MNNFGKKHTFLGRSQYEAVVRYLKLTKPDNERKQIFYYKFSSK
jgi:hypothetical protein